MFLTLSNVWPLVFPGHLTQRRLSLASVILLWLMSHSDKSNHPNDEYKSHIDPNTTLNMQLESKRDMGPRRSPFTGGRRWASIGSRQGRGLILQVG